MFTKFVLDNNNLKRKCTKNKQILTSIYIGILLQQSSGNETLFQQLYSVLTQYIPIRDLWMKNSITSVKIGEERIYLPLKTFSNLEEDSLKTSK